MSQQLGTFESVSIRSIMQKVGQKTQVAEKTLSELTKSMDPSNPADMLNFQRALAEWSLATELQSSAYKSIKDVIRGVIQKTT